MESERGRRAEWAEAIKEGCLEEETELDTKSVICVKTWEERVRLKPSQVEGKVA